MNTSSIRSQTTHPALNKAVQKSLQPANPKPLLRADDSQAMPNCLLDASTEAETSLSTPEFDHVVTNEVGGSAGQTHTQSIESASEDKVEKSQEAAAPCVSNHPMCSELSPFPTGLVIASVDDKCCMSQVRMTLTDMTLKKNMGLGIPMPDVESVCSVFSGRPRQLELAKLTTAASISEVSNVVHDVVVFHAPDKMVWTSNEGGGVLPSLINNTKGWVILEQVVEGALTADLVQGVLHLRSMAQQAGVRVLLLVGGLVQPSSSLLSQICEEYLEINSCEPDIEVDSSFSIACDGVRELHSRGIGKVMCNITFSEGAIHRHFESFISNDLATRLMWSLRGQGKTLEEIGSLLKVNKSSVLRRLKGLPPTRFIAGREEWIARHLDFFQEVSTKKAVSGSVSEVVIDAA